MPATANVSTTMLPKGFSSLALVFALTMLCLCAFSSHSFAQVYRVDGRDTFMLLPDNTWRLKSEVRNMPLQNTAPNTVISIPANNPDATASKPTTAPADTLNAPIRRPAVSGAPMPNPPTNPAPNPIRIDYERQKGSDAFILDAPPVDTDPKHATTTLPTPPTKRDTITPTIITNPNTAKPNEVLTQDHPKPSISPLDTTAHLPTLDPDTANKQHPDPSKKNEQAQTKPEKKKDKQNEKKTTDAKKIKPNKKPACAMEFDGVDEFTGKLKRVTAARVFFTYTPEKAKKYLRGDDYLTVTGNLSTVNSMTTVHLNFAFDSPHAGQDYGGIEEGSRLLIKLIDGNSVELSCDKGDRGRIDKINGRTLYEVFYVLDDATVRQLERSEPSKVRVFWSAGYEEYEIYNLDYFKEQLQCLDR